MPRYFFHVHDGREYPDHDGTELPDLQAARVEAAKLAGRLMSDAPAEFWNAGEWTVEVKDDRGQVRLVLSFSAKDATG